MAGLPSWVNAHMRQRLVPSPKNPLDVSTIISIYPMTFTEKKAMMPEWYTIEAGSIKQPSFKIVEGASAWADRMADMPMLEIPISSISVAESVIRDWMVGIMEVVLGTAQPGVFFLPGSWDMIKLQTDVHAIQVFNTVINMQKAWFLKLINIADAMWARSNGNPLVISELQRIAAEHMQMEEKPWMKNFTVTRMTNCPACGTMVQPGYPICSNCKIIVDPEGFKQLNLSFASQNPAVQANQLKPATP